MTRAALPSVVLWLLFIPGCGQSSSNGTPADPQGTGGSAGQSGARPCKLVMAFEGEVSYRVSETNPPVCASSIEPGSGFTLIFVMRNPAPLDGVAISTTAVAKGAVATGLRVQLTVNDAEGNTSYPSGCTLDVLENTFLESQSTYDVYSIVGRGQCTSDAPASPITVSGPFSFENTASWNR